MIRMDVDEIQIEYDREGDCLLIEGIRYAGGLFRGMALFREGDRIQIVKRKDGILTVKTLHGDA